MQSRLSRLGLRSTSPGKAPVVQFGALALLWGLSFLFIKIGERSFAPLQVSFGRVLVGAVVLGLVTATRRQRLPAGPKTWAHLFVTAIFLNALPFSLFAYGELHTSSALAGIWNAATPLFTLPIAVWLIADERVTSERAAGLALGFVGVLIVLGIWKGLEKVSPEGNLLCLGAAASYGIGFPYTRRFLADRPEGPLSLATGQLMCATVQLAVLTLLLTSPPHRPHVGPVLCVVALGAFGTGAAYVLNYALIRSLGATGASTVTYVIPVFSTLAGVVLLHEPLAANEPLGALVILTGAALAQGRLRTIRNPSPRRPTPHHSETQSDSPS